MLKQQNTTHAIVMGLRAANERIEDHYAGLVLRERADGSTALGFVPCGILRNERFSASKGPRGSGEGGIVSLLFASWLAQRKDMIGDEGRAGPMSSNWAFQASTPATSASICSMVLLTASRTMQRFFANESGRVVAAMKLTAPFAPRNITKRPEPANSDLGRTSCLAFALDCQRCCPRFTILILSSRNLLHGRIVRGRSTRSLTTPMPHELAISATTPPVSFDDATVGRLGSALLPALSRPGQASQLFVDHVPFALGFRPMVGMRALPPPVPGQARAATNDARQGNSLRQISKPLRWNGRERIRGQRRHVRRVIGVEPCPFDPRRVGEPRQVLRRFILFDKGGEVPAVLEQQRRCRWRDADVKARHGAEELDIGDPLDGRIGSGKRIDQADCDVVTVDIVALDRRLPTRAHDTCRCRARVGSVSPRAKTAAKLGCSFSVG
jgi:hypothetical protein